MPGLTVYPTSGGGGGGAPDAHAASHASGGSDPLAPLAPAVHAASHEKDGADELDANDLAFSYVPQVLTPNWSGIPPADLHEALDRLSEGLVTVAPIPTPTLGPGDFYYPASLPGVKLWLRADLGLTQGGATRVTSWIDQVSGAEFVNASDNTTNPTFLDASINTKPSVRFERASFQRLQASVPGLFPFTDYPFYLFAVVRPKQIGLGGANVGCILGISNGATAGALNNGGVMFGTGSVDPNPGANDKHSAFGQTYAANGGSSAFSAEADHGMGVNLWTTVSMGCENQNQYKVRVGETAFVDTTLPGQQIVAHGYDAMGLGMYPYGGTPALFSDHDIAEVVVFDTYPDNATLDLLNTHVESYYGFSLPVST